MTDITKYAGEEGNRDENWGILEVLTFVKENPGSGADQICSRFESHSPKGRSKAAAIATRLVRQGYLYSERLGHNQPSLYYSIDEMQKGPQDPNGVEDPQI